MALLGTPLSNPKTHHSYYHNRHFHQLKPLNLSHFSKISNTHLSVKLKNSSLRCYSQKQSQSTQKPIKEEENETKGSKKMGVQEYEFERLFSNLNQATLKHEPGLNLSSICSYDLKID